MNQPTFEELAYEYRQELIGGKIYSVLRELSATICRRYSETVYNGGLAWDGQSIDDLCQEVVLDQLLGQGQIHFVFDEATSVSSFRRLVSLQVKRSLIARRKKTPVDRLLIRIRDLSYRGELEFINAAVPYFRRPGSSATHQPLTDHQLSACSKSIAHIPRLVSRLDAGRESMIFTPDSLKTAVERLFQVAPAITVKEIRTILEELLTPWAPASLVSIESRTISTTQYTEDSIEEEQMIAAAQTLAERLSFQQRVVLISKSQDIPDAEVAASLGISRPTVANIKKRVFTYVAEELVANLEPHHHERAMHHLLDQCTWLIEANAE